VPADTRQTHNVRKQVFQKLEELIDAGRLVYPHETYNELKDGNAKVDDSAQDHAYYFVERCKKTALRTANLDIVKELVAHTLVRRVVDPDAEKDEADIYVLGVAVELQRAGKEVGVLTQEPQERQERKDQATKLSMNTACGLLGLVCCRCERCCTRKASGRGRSGGVPVLFHRPAPHLPCRPGNPV
jgi:hypothetical protein